MNRYSFEKDKNVPVSEHFKVYEFASTSPNSYAKRYKLYSDVILINSGLINKLEKLMSIMNCDYCYINSGYRTVQHDIDVGGNGKGQHTLGNAADCIFKDNHGFIIDPRYISIYAQLIGFNGIARIGNSSIHLDVRQNSIYFGDETVSINHLTNDFKLYYNISSLDAYEYLQKLWR